MYNYQLPQSLGISPRTENISGFKGVDFTNSPFTVDSTRSIDSLNMIPDQMGYPTRRKGYRTYTKMSNTGAVPLEFTDKINALITSDNDLIAVHCGTKLYAKSTYHFTTDYLLIRDDMNDAPSSFFWLDGDVYILDGKDITCLTFMQEARFEWVKKELEKYIPTTSINGKPGGVLPPYNGESYEPVNMLSSTRINTFTSDGTNSFYPLDVFFNSGVTVTLDSVEYLKEGEWTSEGIKTNILPGPVGQSSPWKVMVSLDPEDPSSIVPLPEASEDNVRIKFTINNDPKFAEYYNKIMGCTIVTSYGYQGMTNRLFISGNNNYPGQVWWSEVMNGSSLYFPDINYAMLGNSPVMGFARLTDGSLSVIKKRAMSEPSIYYINTDLVYNDSTSNSLNAKEVFRFWSGPDGAGAASKRAIANLLNEPLMLSEDGVFALTPVYNSAVNERYAEDRSFYINERLRKEPKDNAIAIECKGFWYLAINNHMYVADSRQYKSGQLEWYYWENIPASAMSTVNGNIIFGTEEGKIFIFSDDETTDNGEKIICYWLTPPMTLGIVSRYKSLSNLYISTGDEIDVEVITDKFKQVTNINSENEIVATNLKIKRFMTIQIKISDGGFYGITLIYNINGSYKGMK